MDSPTHPDTPHVSKNVQTGPRGDQQFLPAQLGAIAAVIAALIVIYVHQIPLPQIAGSYLKFPFLSVLGIGPVLITPDQGLYVAIAVVCFVVVCFVKFFIKNPGGVAWRNIWWASLVLDTIFDAIYVATIYFNRGDLFLGAIAAMIAVDAIILSRDHFNVAYILAADIIEALVFAGLTLLFMNLVVFKP